MKKILVATDYSKEARHALLFAIDMAHRSKAEIILVHAFNEPISVTNAFYLEKAIDDLEKEKNKLLEEYILEKVQPSEGWILQFIPTQESDIKEKVSPILTQSGFHVVKNDSGEENFPVKITCVCKFGLPEEIIPVVAKTFSAELVIMGMRGAGALRQAFLGSTVAAIIQSGKVPVLALPLNARLKNQTTFVFASDLTILPDLIMLERLREMAKLFRADVKILHLYQDNVPQQELQKVKPALEKLDAGLYDIIFEVYFQNSKDIATGIQDFLQNHQADLLALVPKHHSFLEILLQDTVTGFMMKQAALPLLTFPYATHTEKVEIQDTESISHLNK